MEFEELIEVVGEERYRLACEWALRTAADTGAARPPIWPDGLDEIPHDLSDPLWYDGDVDLGERLRLGIRLLREMPCYANTMYLLHFYEDWSSEQRALFWTAFLAMLDDEDERYSATAGYSLWADLFGSGERGRAACAVVFGDGRATPVRRLDRVLPLTGPVPWQLKAPLLAELAVDQARHAAIYRALVGAEFDYFGSIDRQAARGILDGLLLPLSTEHLADLKARLLSRSS